MQKSSRGARIALYALGAVVLVAAIFVVQLLHAAGQFKTLEPHFEGSCTPVPGIPGAEDITVHPRTGVAYITSADRRSAMAGGPAEYERAHPVRLDAARWSRP